MVGSIMTDIARNIKLYKFELQPQQIRESIIHLKNGYMTQIIRIDKLCQNKLQRFMKITLDKGNWYLVKHIYGSLIQELLQQLQQILNGSNKALKILIPFYQNISQLFDKLNKRVKYGLKNKQQQRSQTISEIRKARAKKIQECTDKASFQQNQKKNQLFLNFVNLDSDKRKQIESQNLGTSRQKKIEQVIYEQQYHHNPEFQQLFNKIKREKAHKQSIEAKKQKNKDFRHNFIKQIHDQRHSPIDHLCCSQFFYQNQPIFNKNVDQLYEIDVFQDFNTINQNRIRQSVVSLLNCRGGLILFDVGGQSSEVRVKGAKVNETNKQQYQQRIQSFLKDKISPKIINNIDYFFDWVPVIQDPFSNARQYVSEESDSVLSGISSKSKNQKKVRAFIQGRFVLRIKIFPSQPDIIYHEESQIGQYIYTRRAGKSVLVQAKQVRNVLIKRFQENYRNKIYHSHSYYPICEPVMGLRIFDEAGSLKGSVSGKNYQNKYKSCSLLVVDKSNKAEVQKSLAKQKIECLIYEAFMSYGFRLSNSTFIIEHNQRFDRVRSIVENIKRRKHGIQNAKLISTMTTLEVQKSIQSQQIVNLEGWLRNRFPQQKMQSIYYNRKHYFITQSNLGAIFIYFLLDNYHIKSKFRKIPEQANVLISQKNNTNYEQQLPQQMIYSNGYENMHYYVEKHQREQNLGSNNHYGDNSMQESLRLQGNNLTSNMKEPQERPNKK